MARIEENGGAASIAHSWSEDIQALLTSSIILSLGLQCFSSAQVFPGGVTGLVLLIQHWTGWPFGIVFFALNLPFYGLAIRHIGLRFTIRTLVAVSLVSIMSEVAPHLIGISSINPVYGAIIAGVLFGLGLLILFRHHASLGGFSVLALYLQARHGLRAGYVQMAIDAVIVGASAMVVSLEAAACSILAVIVLNLVIASNHRPGRYMGV
ncbi:YitT family protein [Thauera sp.]|uniref:YitT family protein n=1 Tax=Thauera sp. TaxID=1905334 RepID=UPI0039E35F0C